MAVAASYQDISRSFLDALLSLGVAPSRSLDFQADGAIHRYRVDGDKPGSKNGWYVLYDDSAVPAGAFGSWRTGVSGTWSAKSESTMTVAERDAWKRRMQEARDAHERELKKLRMDARERANKLWNLAKAVSAVRTNAEGVLEGHPYLIAKGVKPYGVRALKSMLIVPVRSVLGHLMSLQFIGPDGSKRFLTGGEIAGGYCAIGRPEGTLCIAEGFATAASIRDATGFAVAVAFNAGNLAPVARVLREKFPALRILICADNDQFTEGNPGRSQARSAAETAGGLVVEPVFEPHELESKPTDFNDLHRLRGLDAVRDTILAVCDNVVPIGAARSRRDLEKLIESEEDFDVLTEQLAGQVNSSGLPKAAREYLLSKIARRAGVPKSSLMLAGGDGRAGGGESSRKDGGSDRIDELNEKHAVIPIGGRVLVLNREWDPVMERPLLTFSDRSNFEIRYCNQRIWHQGEDVPLGKLWMEHPSRREYDGMVFLPGNEAPGYLNLWMGWGAEPKPGCCRRFLDFVADVICDGDDQLTEYLISWCAHLVQRPAELPETALVLRGDEGIGKNTFVDALKEIVGLSHFLLLSSLNQVTGRFSGHLANALLVFCNESVWGGDKSSQGVLKSMITDDVQPIEYKGRDLIIVRSFRRFIFATNEHWAVPRGHDDRRYVITDVSARHKRDHAYFSAIRDELRDGGVSALMHYLSEYDISQWHPRQVPDRLQERGWEMKIESAGSAGQWWFDMLHRGWLIEDCGAYADENRESWPLLVASEQMRNIYLRWCHDQKVAHTEKSSLLGKYLHAWGVAATRPSADNPDRKPFYRVPDLERARLKFGRVFSIPAKVWATDGAIFGDSDRVG